MYYYHNCKYIVFSHEAQALDTIVAIDEFKQKCRECLAQDLSKDGNGEFDFSEIKTTMNPYFNAVYRKYIIGKNWISSLERKFTSDMNDNNDFLKHNRDRNSDIIDEDMEYHDESTHSPLRLDSKKYVIETQRSGIESAGSELVNFFRGDTLSPGNIQMLLEMRYMTIFDNIREEAAKQLLNAWHIFAKQEVCRQYVGMRPNKVYEIDYTDFSIKWLNVAELYENMKQKSIYQRMTGTRISNFLSPIGIKNDVPKEE